MQASTTRTVRFTEIVKRCGRPELVTLWSDPKKDNSFTRAVEQQRVMTIKQETVGTKKDFGIIGFLEERNVSYLVFPKTLKPFSDCRVIGVKYDLIEQPEIADPVKSSVRKLAQKPKAHPASKSPVPVKPPAPSPTKTFSIRLTCAVQVSITHKVEAFSRKEAEGKALQLILAPSDRSAARPRSLSPESIRKLVSLPAAEFRQAKLRISSQ